MKNKRRQLETFSFVTSTCDDGIIIGGKNEDYRNGISGDFDNSSLTIPSHIGNLPVVELGINSLASLSFIIVYVPGTVKRMLRGVFFRCSKLESVHFLSENGKYSLVKFGDGVFDRCSSLKRVVIPSTLSVLPSYLFSDCESLLEVVYCGSTHFTQTYSWTFWPSATNVKVYVSPHYRYKTIAGKSLIRSSNQCPTLMTCRVNPKQRFIQANINMFCILVI